MKLMLFVAFFFFAVDFSFCKKRSKSDGTLVTLPEGIIRGKIDYSFTGKIFWAFKDVPYAAPPLGKLRFKPPVPVDKWEGILDTTKNRARCYLILGTDDRETEDCLKVHVFTPENPSKAKGDLPVLLFVHGGYFRSGSAPLYPEYLIDHDVVVVTVQYRLGPWGFLSTVDNVIEGNQGLKDVALALKWVNKNIHLFGGDKEKVTLGGQSAGAAIVSFLLLNHQTKGLIRGAIMESASAICSWGYQKQAREIAFTLGTMIDPSFSLNSTSEELLILLQNTDPSKIDGRIMPFDDQSVGSGNIWAPVVESSENPFISQKMHELFQDGEFTKVPVLIGINSEERIKMAEDLEVLMLREQSFDDDLTLIVKDGFNVDGKDKEAFGEYLRGLYTDGLFQDNLGRAIAFESDARYTTSVTRQAHLQSKFIDVFFYEFSYDGELGGVNIIVDGAERVAHHEEMNYYWGNIGDITAYPEEDQLVQKRFVHLLVNFIKHLNPTPNKTELLQNVTWPKLTPTNLTYLDIGKDLVVRENPKKYKEWKEGIEKFGHPPFITY